MIIGVHGAYRWAQAEKADLAQVLAACPELVVGRRVVVTCADGAPYRLTDTATAAGWTRRGGSAISPELAAADVPTAPDTELWVFEGDPPTEPLERFATLPGFSLRDPYLNLQDAGRGRREVELEDWADEQHSRLERFWSDIERFSPETYLGQGRRLLVVTRNVDLFVGVSMAAGRG